MLLRELRRIGYLPDALRVDTEPAMAEALRDPSWDVVISDWSVPPFSGLGALATLRQTGLDIPFLIISGTVGEETAVEALRAGAHDFLVKDRLARLGVAIERVRREASMRTERARMHEQLMISDRMASVGILAAGVAHEINNPLSAVLANLDMALDDLSRLHTDPSAETVLREELDDARVAADRVRRIVGDLQIFSRSEQDEPGPTNVQAVLESTLRMATNEIRHRAQLVRDYQPVPSVHGSESRLGQVFLNLIVNAAQALPEGKASSNQIRVSTHAYTDTVGIAVADTGPGLPATVRQRLFMPFVTTKPPGFGTGLGLSICHRIVTDFGGHIRVESGPTGTTFEVILPVAAESHEPARLSPRVSNAPRRGRVLVVDDEAVIARTIERALAKAHDVTSFSSAREALDLIRSGSRFDVILCDLMMPDISGADLHVELTRAFPDQAARMVFLTGGAFTPAAASFLENVENAQVGKPFEPKEIRELIATMVARESER